MPGNFTREVYAGLAQGSLAAAKRILPLLWKYRAFESVIDVGCGTGAWLATARELGARRILGLDFSLPAADLMLVQPDEIKTADLELSIAVDNRFDLCLCLEVAEHLSQERAESFVSDLTALADIILFSAAIPFQGGHGHVNEQWPEYWAQIFGRCGYLVWDAIREKVWACQEIPWWYRQNALVFLKDSEWGNILPGEKCPQQTRYPVLTRIHPECYLWTKRGPESSAARSRLYSTWS